MTPVSRCLSLIDSSVAAPDAGTVPSIDGMLDELEASYYRPSERIVALEAVLHGFTRSRQIGGTRLGRFLRLSIDRRQNRLARLTV